MKKTVSLTSVLMLAIFMFWFITALRDPEHGPYIAHCFGLDRGQERVALVVPNLFNGKPICIPPTFDD